MARPGTMERYYGERASEYDLFYEVPEFADELGELREWVAEAVRGRHVLEIAAGTGYWTEVAARAAAAVTATDFNPSTLAVAAKRDPGPHVSFVRADAYALPALGTFDAAMAHLWWSHVPKERRRSFLLGLRPRLRPGATILMIDQNHVAGFSPAASRRDGAGNRYERRRLNDGREFEVIKNHPTVAGLHGSFAAVCDEVRVTRLRYFWSVSGRLR